MYVKEKAVMEHLKRYHTLVEECASGKQEYHSAQGRMTVDQIVSMPHQVPHKPEDRSHMNKCTSTFMTHVGLGTVTEEDSILHTEPFYRLHLLLHEDSQYRIGKRRIISCHLKYLHIPKVILMCKDFLI